MMERRGLQIRAGQDGSCRDARKAREERELGVESSGQRRRRRRRTACCELQDGAAAAVLHLRLTART